MFKVKYGVLTAGLMIGIIGIARSGDIQGAGGGPQPEALTQIFKDLKDINKNTDITFDRIVDSKGNYYMLSASGQLFALGTFEGGGGPNPKGSGTFQGGGGGRGNDLAAGTFQGGGGPSVMLSADGDIQGGGGGPQYVLELSTTVAEQEHTFLILGNSTKNIPINNEVFKSDLLSSGNGKILEVLKIDTQIIFTTKEN